MPPECNGEMLCSSFLSLEVFACRQQLLRFVTLRGSIWGCLPTGAEYSGPPFLRRAFFTSIPGKIGKTS